ncbi:MAG: (2Fe-2S)-binding protein [Tenuifilaceae bacterium]|jgi:NAD(P)H-nitrite reductase large subunit|nr:(2Fe-2S)-binding protein [Tenuifilaceae bacterium]
MNRGSKYICHCKSVTPNEVKKAIREKGARTLVDLQNLTQASTGCGRCRQPVLQVLDKELAIINAKGTQLRLDF